MYRLKLDHDGVYWGAEPIDQAEIMDGDVVLDHAPDNLPGRYRWSAELKQFVALPPSQIKTSPEAPSLDQAFHHLVQSLAEGGHALPVAVHAWCEQFRKTIESR